MDCISEVDIQTKQLVWEWCFQDHLIQNFSPSANNYATDIANQYYGGNIEEAFYRRLDVNVKTNQGTIGPHSDWTHINSMDYNEERDEVVLNSRQHSEFYVVDHNTTTAEAKGKKGDFLYRFGSPYNYASDDQLGAGKGKAKFPTFFSAELTQIWGAHNIHWIPKGRPGGGNFLIFDNGVGRVTGGTYSAILEIKGVDASGKYVKELDAGYGGPMYPSGSTGTFQLLGIAGQTMMKVSKQVVWGYSAMTQLLLQPVHLRMRATGQRQYPDHLRDVRPHVRSHSRGKPGVGVREPAHGRKLHRGDPGSGCGRQAHHRRRGIHP